MRRLGPADYRVMPWKNGGGTTTELMIWPPGASLDGAFDWRISMADVAHGGPFSRFPGYDRKLMLVAGVGMVLEGPAMGEVALAPLVPIAFSGDDEVSGVLSSGSVRDFNVMTRRSTAEGSLATHQLTNARTFAAGDAIAFITVLAGDVVCAGSRLAPEESLVLDPGETADLSPIPGAEATVAVTMLAPVQRG